jgi:hypothetical protein
MSSRTIAHTFNFFGVQRSMDICNALSASATSSEKEIRMRSVRQLLRRSIVLAAIVSTAVLLPRTAAAQPSERPLQGSIAFDVNHMSQDEYSGTYLGAKADVYRNFKREMTYDLAGVFDVRYGHHSDSSFGVDSSDNIWSFYVGPRLTFSQSRFAPFVGFELGYTLDKFSDTFTATSPTGGTQKLESSDSQGGFGWLAQGGASYPINMNLNAYGAIGYGHRSFNESDKLGGWDVELGVRGCPICWLKGKSK